MQGRTLVFLDHETKAISFKTQGWAKHEPKEPQSERVVHGPREGFTETLSENIGMIRRWIQDRRLRADNLELGRRTKTKIAVMYLHYTMSLGFSQIAPFWDYKKWVWILIPFKFIIVMLPPGVLQAKMMVDFIAQHGWIFFFGYPAYCGYF